MNRVRTVATTLCVILVPAAVDAQPTPKPAPPGSPPGPSDFLQAVNETPGTARLELFAAGDPMAPGSRGLMFACLKPKESVRWLIDNATQGGKIRLQVMQGEACEEPPKTVCQHAIDRAPGLQYVTLRGERNQCGVFPMPGPPGGALKAAAGDCGGHWAPLTIQNLDKVRGAWITVYDAATNIIGDHKILAAACWKPQETRMACVDRRNLIIRAEMTGLPNGWRKEDNCNARVTCDTSFSRAKRVDMGGGGPVTIKVDRDSPTGCWWSTF